jgi:hypothetical protein
MELTDLFIRKLKHSGKPSGDKYSGGRSLYLLVKKSNKYWRMNYRYEGKFKTLAFGTYPEVSLAEVRRRAQAGARRSRPQSLRRRIGTRRSQKPTRTPSRPCAPVTGEDRRQPQRRDPREGAGLIAA